MIAVTDLMAQSDSGRALVDLQAEEYGFWVEPGVDHSMVDVLCPSGRFMNLEAWTAELGFGTAGKDTGVVIYSSGASSELLVEKSVPPCNEPGCELELEADGRWACLCPGP